MSKFTITGLVACVLGALLLGFQALSIFMGTEGRTMWKSLALIDVAEKNYFNWINDIPWISVQTAINYVVNVPLYLLLFCFGILCFLINAFRSKA